MKKIVLAFIFISGIGVLSSQAQHVRVRLDFPVGVHIGAPGPTPFSGAIWIGPEWQWRERQYVYVPGYWARPKYNRAIWVPGQWKYSRHGYRWVPGHWR